MSPETIMGLIISYLFQVVVVLVVAIVATRLFRNYTKNTKWNLVGYCVHLGLVTAIGWSLVIASSVFNYTFTLEIMSGVRGYEHLASAAAKCAVGVNLAGGVALHMGAVALHKKRKAVGWFALYIPILLYSLLAGSSVLQTGDEATRFEFVTSQIQQQHHQSNIVALQNANTRLSNTIPSEFIGKTVNNSRGVAVSIAHCANRTGYYSKQPICQQYLSALSSSNQGNIDANNEKIKATRESLLEGRRATKQPMKANLLGLTIPPSIAVVFLAVAIEVAALIMIIKTALIGPPPSPSPEIKTVQTAVKPVVQRSGPKQRSERSGNEINDLQRSEPVARKTYYEHAKLASRSIFTGKQTSPVTESQLDGFLLKLAAKHADEPAIANRIMDDVKELSGVGVGKQTVLSAMLRNPEAIEVIEGTPKSYVFRKPHEITSSNPVHALGQTRTVGSSEGAVRPLQGTASSPASTSTSSVEAVKRRASRAPFAN